MGTTSKGVANANAPTNQEPAKKPGATPAASNAGAERKAATARALKKIPQEWRTLAGGLLEDSALPKPPVTLFKTASYYQMRSTSVFNKGKLVQAGPVGVEDLLQYLLLTEQTAHHAALTSVRALATRDNAPVKQITDQLLSLIGCQSSSTANLASLDMLAMYATLSKAGKAWFKSAGHIWGPTHAWGASMMAFNPGVSKTILAMTSMVMTGAKAKADDPSAPKEIPLTITEMAMYAFLKVRIEAALAEGASKPSDKPKDLEALRAQQAKRGAGAANDQVFKPLLAAVKAAPEAVKTRLYNEKSTDGTTLIARMQAQLSPTQMAEMSMAMDPVEQLFQDCQTVGTGDKKRTVTGAERVKEGIKRIEAFLLRHLADQSTRMRVLAHARLMDDFIQPIADGDNERHAYFMRVILTGRVEKDEFDELQSAARDGNGAAAIKALLALSAKAPERLPALQTNHVFIHKLRDMTTQVEYEGLKVAPYHLFLRLCGHDPFATSEPGLDRSKAVNPSANPEERKPLTPSERSSLNAYLYDPHIPGILEELNATFKTLDGDILDEIRQFVKKFSEPEIVKKLRRANESPGPELHRRMKATGCNVQLKLKRGCSEETIIEVERALGIRGDSATIGVIGGAVKLETDYAKEKHEEGKGTVPLPQALRETRTSGGDTLTAHIHKHAQKMHDELTEWTDSDEDDVREIYNDYTAGVPDAMIRRLREQTGQERLWKVELLANAYSEIAKKSLSSALIDSGLDLKTEYKRIVRLMGMTPEDVSFRIKMADMRAKQNDAAAAKKAREQVRAEAKAAAESKDWTNDVKKLWDALSTLRPDSEQEEFQAAGKVFADAKIHQYAGITAQGGGQAGMPGSTALGPASVQGEGKSQTLNDRYRAEYGIYADRQLIEIAKTFSQPPERSEAVLKGWLGIAAMVPVNKIETSADVSIKPHERSLVRPKFLVPDTDGGSKEARLIADKIWKDLHKHGQIQILMNELETCSFKEQQLIHSAFRNLSGDLDLRFYIQQMKVKTQKRQSAGEVAKTQIPFRGPDLELLRMSVGAAGSAAGAKTLKDANIQGSQVTVAGDVPELDDALAITKNGKVPFKDNIASAVSSNNLERLYELLDNATDDEKRSVIADKPLYNTLGKVADDPYEWSRVYKQLHGKASLFDMLESRAHGKGVLECVFGGTDEAGIRKDIKTWIRRRKKELVIQFEKPYRDKKPPADPPAAVIAGKVKTQIEADCRTLLANPSLTAILRDELSGTELSSIEGIMVAGALDGNKAGEAESKDAYLLNDGDITEDEERIISDIGKMSVKERKERLVDPEYMRRLHDAMDTETAWRDALTALRSQAEPAEGDDPLLKLEKASRTSDEDSTEINVEETDILKALAELNEAQYKRLMADPRLMAQVMKALKGDDEQKIARQMMSFRFEDAAAETGLQVGDDTTFDYKNGKFPKKEIERLAYLKYNAVMRVSMACNGDGGDAWDTLLHGLVAVYKMKLAPEPGQPAAVPGMPAGAAPTLKKGDDKGKPKPKPDPVKRNEKPKPKDAPKEKVKTKEEYERDLRAQIWAEVQPEVNSATKRWWQNDTTTGDKRVATQKAILKLKDPSSLLLKTHTSVLGDSEDGIKKTLKEASATKLINKWTTIKNKTADNSPSMKDVYQQWLAARGGKKDSKTPESDSKNLSAARVAMAVFQNYAIDTSKVFEKELIAFSGGLLADDDEMADGAGRFDVRDNSEWLEWRTIIRGRIPDLTKKNKPEVMAALGASGDKEAESILDNPNRDLMTQFAYDRENYLVNRGEDSNYNMDRVTAGAEGQALDRSFGDYGQTITNAVVDKDAKQYNNITAVEQAEIQEKKGINDGRLAAFKSAKDKVAEIAATVVALIITAVITVLTWGSGAAGAPAIMAALKAAAIGAGTAGASALGATATKEAIMGTGYEWTREGLQTIAKDTVMGFVTAGAQYYAGAVVQSAARSMASAAGQSTSVAAAFASNPPFLGSLFMEAGEEALQTGMEGLFEAGMAGFDPALWLQGFSTGFDRASGKVGERAGQIPEDMLRAAVAASLTTGISHAAGGLYKGAKKKAGFGADDVTETAAETAGDTIADAGKKKGYAERAATISKKMVGEVPDSLTETATDMIMDEKSYRAEGWDDDAVLEKTMKGALDNMKSVAKQLHIADAHLNARIHKTLHQLNKHGSRLTSKERTQYERVCIASEGSGVMSVANFIKVRQAHIDTAVARHEATTGQKLSDGEKTAYAAFVRAAETLGEFDDKLLIAPDQVPAVVDAAPASGDSKTKDARAAAAKEAAETTKKEQADPTTPAKAVTPALTLAIPIALAHAKATVIDSRQALLARNQADATVKSAPEANRAALQGDLLKVNVAWSLAMESAATANNAARNLQTSKQVIDVLIGQLDGKPNDPKISKHLYEAVIKARIALALETKTVAAEAAKAKEASLLAQSASLELQGNARRLAAGGEITTETATDVTPTAPPTPPVDKTEDKTDDKESKVEPAKEEPPKVDPTAVVDPDKDADKDKTKDDDKNKTTVEPAVDNTPKPDEEIKDELTLAEQKKLQEFIKMYDLMDAFREFKAWRAEQKTEAENKEKKSAEKVATPSDQAAAVAGSKFKGNALSVDAARSPADTRAAMHSAINGLISTGFFAGVGDVKLNKDSVRIGKETFQLRHFTPKADDKMPPVATFDEDSKIIRVSTRARPQDIERALAHEISELVFNQNNTDRADGSALSSEGKGSKMHGHDAGRIAELRILARRLDGVKNPDAELVRDIMTLAMELRLVSVGGDRIQHNVSMIEAYLRSIKADADIAKLNALVKVANDKRRTSTLKDTRSDVAADARKVLAKRQENYKKLIDAAKPPEFNALSVGGGPANLINQATLADRGSSGTGTDVSWPDHVTINAAGPESIGKYGTHEFGQKPGELDSPGMNVSAGAKDPDGYTPSNKIADAIAIGEMEQGIAVYRGWVKGPVEARSADSKDWEGSKAIRVWVEVDGVGKWFYTDRCDLTPGPGVSREAPTPWFEGENESDSQSKKEQTAGKEKARAALEAAGVVVNAEAYLGPGGGKVVVISGGGASGSWACETALKSGAERVIWVGRQATKKDSVEMTDSMRARLDQVQAELKKDDLSATEVAALLEERKTLVLPGFKDASLPRNLEPAYSAFNSPKVEFVVGGISKVTEGSKEGTANVKVNGDTVVADKVVTAHGQSPDKPGAANALAGDTKFKMILAADGRVVGLESIDPPGAIRILGSAFATNPAAMLPHVKDQDQEAFKKKIEEQANNLPKDSKTVAASIALARDTITAANDVLNAKKYRLSTPGGELELNAGDEANWPNIIAGHIAKQLGVKPEAITLKQLTAGKSGDPVYGVKLGIEDLGVFKVFANRESADHEFDMIQLLESKEFKKYKVVGEKGDGDVNIGPSGKPRGAVMMETAQGKTVSDMVKLVPDSGPGRAKAIAQIREAVQKCARAMSEFHQEFEGGKATKAQKEADANYMMDKKLTTPETQSALGADYPAILAAVQAAKKEYVDSEMKATAYHGDANIGNFLPQDGKDEVRVIDVGTMVWSVDNATGKGTRTGAADVARFLGSFETLYPGKLKPDELKSIQTAFNRSYFRSKGAKPKGFDAAQKLYRLELELAILKDAVDKAPVIARIKDVLGIR